MEYLTLAMVWVLSGLFVAYLMKRTDESKEGKRNWITNRGSSLSSTLVLVAIGPISLLLGIVVMTDYIDK